jgi:hypothetical protein
LLILVAKPFCDEFLLILRMSHSVVVKHFETLCRIAITSEAEWTEVSVVSQTVFNWRSVNHKHALQLNMVSTLDNGENVFHVELR